MRQENTNEIPVATGALLIFVYGTLKQGQVNHDRFCRTALCIEEAVVRGRLYELPSRIPVLQVPDNSIIAVGTSDPLLEGFQPELSSMYRRVLVPVVFDDDRRAAAWCYVGDERTIQHAVPTRKTCWP